MVVSSSNDNKNNNNDNNNNNKKKKKKNSNPPTSSKHLYPSTSLSLTLGFFPDGEDQAVDDRKEDGANTTVTEISSETSGPVRSRSDDDIDVDPDVDDGDHQDSNKNKNKKRKKYHHHTAEQIREMEALFKESPHPDEKQRQQLSKRLGLHPRQVKFWFQNRRTQIKAIQERHENSLLKSELDKLGEENKLLRETIKKGTCTSCSFHSSSKDVTTYIDEQHLRVENAKLKAEVLQLSVLHLHWGGVWFALTNQLLWV